MNIHQIVDASIAAGSVLAVLAAWIGIKLTFRRDRELEDA